MHTLSLITIVLATLYVACARPSSNPRPPNKPATDIDLFANQTAPPCTAIDDFSLTKNGLVDPRYRWQSFNVYIDAAYEQADRDAIEIAMWNIMQILPCISFGIWDPGTTPTGDYVRTIKGTDNGCNSQIGRRGGEQTMNLQSPGCMSQGTIIHEMIHALGVDHEHCRFDRNDWVTIHFENILPGYEHSFYILEPPTYDTFGVPYNFHSIMHFGPNFFSSNGQPTIVSKNGESIGSEGVLQDTDIRRLNTMYSC